VPKTLCIKLDHGGFGGGLLMAQVLCSLSSSATNFSINGSPGAAITKLLVPDKNGNKADIVLGYDTQEEYLVCHAFLRSVVNWHTPGV
jgi:aldose 1-epimerase